MVENEGIISYFKNFYFPLFWQTIEKIIYEFRWNHQSASNSDCNTVPTLSFSYLRFFILVSSSSDLSASFFNKPISLTSSFLSTVLNVESNIKSRTGIRTWQCNVRTTRCSTINTQCSSIGVCFGRHILWNIERGRLFTELNRWNRTEKYISTSFVV